MMDLQAEFDRLCAWALSARSAEEARRREQTIRKALAAARKEAGLKDI